MVGSLVIEHVKAAEKGKHFPQFSHVGGSTITCEICLPHQKWAIQTQQSHHKLKTKQVTIESTLQGNAISFFRCCSGRGTQQVQVSSRCCSILHRTKATTKSGSKFSHTGEDNYKEYRTLFQGFFKLGKTSGSDSKAQEIDQKFEKVCCCYLWDPEVVKHFAKDDSIRKLTAKMLF